MSDKTIKDVIETTGETLVKKLRSIVRPKGARPWCLNELDDRQLIEIYHRFRIGNPATKLVKLVQYDWGRCQTTSEKGVIKALYRFKGEAVPLLRQKYDDRPRSGSNASTAMSRERERQYQKAKYIE